MSLTIKIKRIVRSGNIVSKSERKVKRLFFQNKQRYSFYSIALKRKIFILGPASLLREVMIFGSFDRYLIHCGKIHDEFDSIKKEVLKITSEKKKQTN